MVINKSLPRADVSLRECQLFDIVQLELTNANQLLQAEKRDLNSFLEKRDRDIQRLKGEMILRRSVGGDWSCSLCASFFLSFPAQNIKT